MTSGESSLWQPPLMIPPTWKFGVVWLYSRHERRSRIAVAGREEPVADDDAGEAVGVLGDQTEAEQRAPVLAHQREARQVELVEQRLAEPVDVALVGVLRTRRRLVGAAEADQVGCDAPVTGGGQHRDHVAVQVAPRRLAVEQQQRLARLRVGARLVDVVDAQPVAAAIAGVDLDVVRVVRVPGEVDEAVVGRAQALHGAHTTKVAQRVQLVSLRWLAVPSAFTDARPRPSA